MNEDKTLEILKNAILLEKRGHAFYAKVAQQTSAEAVKQFFSLMAEEELNHVRVLSEQFKNHRAGKKFTPGASAADATFKTAASILTQDLKRQISAADYEAAAIAAAMSMEKNAIQVYASRAAEAQDATEKSFYEWLAKWETEHLNFLSRLDKEITEAIWYDNAFWPF
ncbi:MAG: ferritin family protein [Deltaproteobacteria bacterium]|nr:ferritin family protein [Deltaproteobacteria bacterium]